MNTGQGQVAKSSKQYDQISAYFCSNVHIQAKSVHFRIYSKKSGFKWDKKGSCRLHHVCKPWSDRVCLLLFFEETSHSQYVCRVEIHGVYISLYI